MTWRGTLPPDWWVDPDKADPFLRSECDRILGFLREGDVDAELRAVAAIWAPLLHITPNAALACVRVGPAVFVLQVCGAGETQDVSCVVEAEACNDAASSVAVVSIRFPEQATCVPTLRAAILGLIEEPNARMKEE
jgi:hypothetical protein